jgi:hypothetical protein
VSHRQLAEFRRLRIDTFDFEHMRFFFIESIKNDADSLLRSFQ